MTFESCAAPSRTTAQPARRSSSSDAGLPFTAAACKGCGTPLPPPNKGGRMRIWCSERCRKRTSYSVPCPECGAPMSYSEAPGSEQAPSLCAVCNAKRQARVNAEELWLPRRREIERLWAEGKTNREISDLMGLKYHGANISLWRGRGYDLPYRRTPEQIARMDAGQGGRGANLVKARRVRRERQAA